MLFIHLMPGFKKNFFFKRFYIRKCSVSLILGVMLFSPWLTACHQEIEGENIDLPPERPGRFIPEAAEAEARRAKEDVARQERDEARNPEKYKPSAAEPYEALSPGDASSGPLMTGDGHTVIPRAEPVYGSLPKKAPASQ